MQRDTRTGMQALVLLAAALHPVAFGSSLDSITSEFVAAAGEFDLEQIVDGEKALQARGDGSRTATDKYQPFLLITSDGPDQVNAIQCAEQKMFSINADEPQISGTHTEFDVLRITFARCIDGPFSHSQIRSTAEASQLRLKQVIGSAPSNPKLDALARITTSRVGGAEMLQFTVSVFGHGAAFLPTAVVHNPEQPSLVLQVYFADYIHLPANRSLDTRVTKPLRRAMEDPQSFVASLLTRALATVARPSGKEQAR